jgi:hypothetical protein
MLRDIARIPSGAGEKRMMHERLIEMANHTKTIFPEGHSLDGISDTILRMAAKITVPGIVPPVEPVTPHDDKPKVADVVQTANTIYAMTTKFRLPHFIKNVTLEELEQEAKGVVALMIQGLKG